MGLAPTILVLIAGRLVAGLGIGIAAMTVPVYLAEIAPKAYRGRLIAANTCSITIGQLVSILVCIGLKSWRWMFAVSIFPPAVQMLGLIYCPESPKWLYIHNRSDKAVKALKRVYQTDTIAGQTALAVQIKSFEDDKAQIMPYWTQCRELITTNRPALMIGAGLQTLQQFSGMNNVMYYGPTMMQQAGFNGSGKEALWAAVPLYAVAVLGMGIGVKLIDKVGRRALLLWTLPLLTLFLIGISFSFYLLNYQSQTYASLLCLLFSLLFVGSFGLGLGPVPWTLNAELYPMRLRSTASSFSTAANRFGNVVVSMTFLYMTNTGVGQVLTWAMYAGFAVITWVWTYCLVPETKGLALEAVEELLQRQDK